MILSVHFDCCDLYSQLGVSHPVLVWYLSAGYGQLFTFGSNRYGQLGLGDYRRRVSANRVRGILVGQRVVKVACGDGFTVVATSGTW